MASAGQPSNALQNMLRTAVQSVQWTYSLFWHLCPDQGILVWGDGYYNGAIKTRKTVQPMEVSTEEASLQRSQQLRELYDSLSAGETNQPARRPCAALSPEDLTESEWFYLMCVSFSFQPGVGLPGKAYTRRQHVWLTGANEVDSKVFSRAILAKSARVQTVVCIPLMNGVVELGTTERVQEDSALVQHVKTFFLAHHHHQNPTPKPALSGHSTSNPATSCDHHRRYQSSQPTPLAIYAAADPPADPNEEGDEEEEDDDDEEAVDSDSGAETARQLAVEQSTAQGLLPEGGAGEPSELMQLEMSEDIRLGSPDDASNNLDSEFQLMGVSPGAIPGDQQRRTDSYRAESILRWPLVQETTNCAVPPPSSATPALDELTEEDTHYSQTVSTILQHRPSRWPQPSAAAASGINFSFYTAQSAFCKWIPRASELHLTVPAIEGAGSQWLLKYILFTVPFLHTSKSAQKSDPTSRLRRTTGTPQEELSANHVLAERRRREKLNERFIILRSLVPFVTKMDKASILGDTIEYVKQLRRKIQDLEAKPRAIEPERMVDPPPPQRTASVPRSGLTRAGLAVDKRKMRIVEGGGTAKTKAVDSAAGGGGVQVEVSIIESDALVELQCPFREGLLLDVMLTLRDVRLETTAVQSSLNNGVFAAELRAKVKENHLGKKASIMEVKRAIHQIIP